MMAQRDRDILARANEVFEYRDQVGVLHEEIGELMVALSHFNRGRGSISEVAEEMADVMVVFGQLGLWLGIEEQVQMHWRHKVDRLAKRLEDDA